MRVGTAFGYDRLTSYIRTAQSRVQDAQNKVSTGKRIETASDDPTGTRRLLGLSALRSGIAGYEKNLDTAKAALSSTESAYDDLGDLMGQARSLAIQGATSTMDQTGRDAIAAQIGALQDRIVSLGNAQGPDERYLFGGQVTDAKPFAKAADGTLVYAGNATTPSVETGPGERTQLGETGGPIADAFARLTKLKNSLTGGDIAAVSKDRLDEIEDSSDAFSALQGDVGRRLNGIEVTRDAHARRDEEFSARASEIGEVDYASAIVDYTAAQSAYQAALQLASKGFSMGLMDFIR